MDCKHMFELLDEAVARREPLSDGSCNAFRLVNGAGDSMPGIWIDDFAGHWLVQTKTREFPDWLLKSFQTHPANSLYWKVIGSPEKDAPVHVAGETMDTPFEIMENGLRYQVDFCSGYSQGIFLDQREGRGDLRESSDGKRVLNCFSYTCAFGVAAMAGGASGVVNVDMSRNYLDWGRTNYLLNGWESGDKDFIYGDVFDWLKRFAKKGRVFDVVILDPPSFSRNRKGGTFKADKNYPELVKLSIGVLASGGRLLAYSNMHGLELEIFEQLVRDGLAGLPVTLNSATHCRQRDFPGSGYLKRVEVSRNEL